MNQPSQPNQRLKLTQEEGLVGKCDTLEMNYGKEGADDGVGLLLLVAVSLFFSINFGFFGYYFPKNLKVSALRDFSFIINPLFIDFILF